MNAEAMRPHVERMIWAVNIVSVELETPETVSADDLEKLILECFRAGLEALRIMRGAP